MNPNTEAFIKRIIKCYLTFNEEATANTISADQIDEICMEVPAWVSLKSFKGNVIFFGSLRV